MNLIIKKAEKKQALLKACLVGPSGAGKTFTALTFARELAQGGKILVLDSEKGSASLYSDLFEFDVIELWSRDESRRPIADPFSPEKYMEAIRLAEENGYAVLIIDSLTHVWNDEGGFLDIVNRTAARKYKNNSYSAWIDVDPLYRRFLNTITDARLHIICTMRSKSDTALEQENGKNVVKKYGTKAVQREGLEYEFTLFGRMELDNTLIIEKTRCRHVNGAIVTRPTGEFLQPVIAWLNDGAPDERPLPAREDFREDVKGIRVFIGQVFKFSEDNFEQRWEGCKLFVLKHAVADADLTQDDITKLRAYGQAQAERQRAA